jgi:hypothetical protein
VKITESRHLDGSSRLHADNNPGRAEMGKGNPWPKGMHDDLRLPNNATVGETPTEQLRTILHGLGIEGAHRDGRDIICARYFALIKNFHDRAGNDAITAFLQAKANK